MFRSSERGGIHIYVHLPYNQAIGSRKLQTIIEVELKKRKVMVSPGRCEILPSPNKSLRLPLGRGSFLLDPETLQPLCFELNKAIRFIETNLNRRTFRDLFPDLWIKINER